MTPRVKVAVAQLAPVYLDRDKTIAKACDAMREAARNGAQLIAFPESFVPGYPYFAMFLPPVAINDRLQRFFAESVVIPGGSIDELSRAAKEIGIVVVMGLSERAGGTLYNGQVFIGPDGRILATRRKLVPTSHERMVWGRGDGSDLSLVPTDIGVLGGLICYEHSNALFRYALAAEGEEIHVAMWPGGMRSLFGIIDAATRHYAFEAQAFVLNVTSVLTPEVLEALGESAAGKLAPGGGSSTIIGPRGDILAGPLGDEEGFLYAELDSNLITKIKTVVDSAGHYARPDVVWLEIDRRPQRPIIEANPKR
jgi:aliphatic nitrilase